MPSKTLIVAGMHRSGTSLVTNWLYHCGLQVGESLLDAGPGNEDGYYEDVEFLKIHEEILAGNHLYPTGLIYDKKLDISVYQLEKLKSVIKIKNQRYGQWGWKEPRTCLFLKLYRELLPQSKYLVIVRDYASVINSLLKRDFAGIEEKYLARTFFMRMIWTWFRRNRRQKKYYRDKAAYYLKVWIAYNEHILDLLKELPQEDYAVVNYYLLQKSDEQLFSFLTKSWGFTLQYFPFKEVYKENLISRKLNLEPFLTDNTLVAKARAIEGEFKRYMDLY